MFLEIISLEVWVYTFSGFTKLSVRESIYLFLELKISAVNLSLIEVMELIIQEFSQ